MAQAKEKKEDNVDTNEKDTNDKKKKKKKKKKKWDIEEYLGSVSIKLKIKFDPNKGQDPLKEAGWFVNRRGKIIGLNDGNMPKPNDCPETYLVQQYISFVLTDESYYNFKLIRIKQNEELKVARSNIYVSKDYNKKKTVLMVIPGTGIVAAGEFATSVCKFDNIIIGSAFAFIEWAQDKDYGVVLFDPNTLSKHHENVLDEIHCSHVFDTYIKPYLCNEDMNDGDEKKKEDEEDKCIENLLILSHSAGGRRTTYLLKERGEIIQKYIKAVAFTDIKDPKEQVWKYQVGGFKKEAEIIRSIYKQHAKNWVKTKNKKPLDELVKKAGKSVLCTKVSSGHSDHKYTTPSAYTSIVAYFDKQMSDQK